MTGFYLLNLAVVTGECWELRRSDFEASSCVPFCDPPQGPERWYSPGAQMLAKRSWTWERCGMELATAAWFTCDISLRYRYHSMLLLGMTTFSPEDSWHTPYLQVDLWLFVQCTCKYIYIWIDPRYVTWCHLPIEDRWTFAILLARKQARMDDVSRCWKTTPEWMPLKKRQHWSLFRGKMMGDNRCLW